MIQKTGTESQEIWYLYSYTLKQIYNIRKIFSEIHLKNYELMIVSGNIIRLEKVGTIQLPFENESEIILLNIAFALKYNSNLISPNQLRKVGISYYDHPNSMIF